MRVVPSKNSKTKLKPCNHNHAKDNQKTIATKKEMFIKAEPYKHQAEVFSFALKTLEKSKGVALLCDMGTGKTISTIAIAGALFAQNKITKMLVVCPKSIVDVWEIEFNKFADFDFNAVVLAGDTSKKAQMLKMLKGTNLQIAIINYESVWRLEKEILAFSPDFIVCDESSKIKNNQAKQAKALHRLGKISKYNAILTGTPINNTPLDFFSQYKFLDEQIFGKSFYSFRSRYATMGGYQNYQIVGYKNLAELTQKAHSIAFRIKLEDAVDLPCTIDETLVITLEPSAKKIYDAIDKDSHANLLLGEITTTNVLTRLLRLSQCSGGFIPSDADSKVQQVSNAKLDALEDIIDTCIGEEKKMIVFARFVPEIIAIEKLLKSKNIKYSVIKGDVIDRKEQVRQFQEDSDCKVFIGQIATTGMGLTLTAASVAVYYSFDFSYANYQQSRARIHRIGQKQKCLYLHLIAKGTVDEQILEALKNKSDIAKLMVDEYKKLLNGGKK